VSWQGTAVAGGATGDPVGGLLTSEDMCVEGVSCDTFTLTIAGTPQDWINARKLVHVHLGWTIPAHDFDVYIHKGGLGGPIVATSGNGATNGILTSEDTDLDPSKAAVGTGTFSVHVVYWTATAVEQYQATASVIDVPSPPSPTPTPTPVIEPPGSPRFYNYLSPPGVADDAGEPSIGVNPKTEQFFNGTGNGGTVNYFGGFLPYMLRVTFDDSVFPAKANWEKAGLTVATAPRVYGDPILFTDQDTGRTFVSQELGSSPGGSTMEFTDNDGRSFLPSMGSGAPSGIDHQTVGGGPFAAPIPTGVNPLYPNSVWYCSQSVADAVCSISLDGGATFGPAVPMYSLRDCGGLHGHIKIGRDGTAYIPNRGCFGDPTTLTHEGGKPSLIVSQDNGVTWNIRALTQATSRVDRDPSVGVGRDGTVYFAYQAGDGHSRVAISHDKGLTWERDSDIGEQIGIKNSLFHAAVAGDQDRAAVAFFGTTTGGSDYDTPGFEGIWYLYISTTYDGGQTWWTQNVTPDDPVQRNGICGTNAPECRNLLDFFDATIDSRGRVLVGYDDGCVSRACVTGEKSYGLRGGNDFTAKAVIARQTGGKRMYAAFDPPGPVVTPPPRALPPAAGMSCDGNVALDSTGDAGNPVVSTLGSADQWDITGLNFGLTADSQSLETTIRIKNFQTTPVPGTVGAYYRVVWTSAKRNADASLTTKNYATEVNVTGPNVTYRSGEYDVAGEAFVSGTTTTRTGSFVTGVDGVLKVAVPLTALGNPTIPVTDTTTLPAVIEPYAVVFAHEGAVYFTTPVERAPDYGFAGANWAVCLPPTITTIEDDSPSLTYSDGWHTVNSTSASSGHFRLHSGKASSHSARLTFNVESGRVGKLTYYYGTSTKGGTGTVTIDGVARTVNFSGAGGGMKDPVFGPQIEFSNLAPGQHILDITNMSDAVYVDRFVLESSSPTGQAASGPGQTSTNNGALSLGQTLTNNLTVPAGASAISLVAESSNNLPIRLILVSPSGAILNTADSSGGVASISAPVSQSGTYVMKVVNLNAGPVQVWTAATPTVRR
jgi:hypothetical protein